MSVGGGDDGHADDRANRPRLGMIGRSTLILEGIGSPKSSLAITRCQSIAAR